MKALIFDFDGTMIDTEWPEVEAWEGIFARHGFEYPPDAWRATIGRGADQETERPALMLANLIGDSSLATELADEHRAARIEIIDRQPILPGVVRLLDEAKAAGLRLAVASSSDHAWVERHLSRIGLRDRFEFLCCREDVAVTKPDPALYRLALSRLGMAPNEVAAIEDSPSGLASAQAAGIFTVVIPNRLTAQMDLSPADWLVDSLEEVSLEEIKRRLNDSPKRSLDASTP